MNTRRFPKGTHVHDRETRKDGILMDYMDDGDPLNGLPHKRSGLRAYIRPVGGGYEWDADPQQLERIEGS
jgi:hypothetical protein